MRRNGAKTCRATNKSSCMQPVDLHTAPRTVGTVQYGNLAVVRTWRRTTRVVARVICKLDADWLHRQHSTAVQIPVRRGDLGYRVSSFLSGSNTDDLDETHCALTQNRRKDARIGLQEGDICRRATCSRFSKQKYFGDHRRYHKVFVRR